MSKILCKNVNLQGKQRVYFSCHPDDFLKYFEGIKSEILAAQNCAVYYDEELTAPFDKQQLFSDLSQMQLFVMPVTTKLLTTKNRALDIEFAFAMKQHIPVLPLMQESGLEKLFNMKCGDLQFLDKNNKDITAISYEEKLKTYLNGVLIGDELAEKVRAAFDAYIFLSYRKKDRKYAQELMRLIHKNDFCRDIAIWYDEFLTPGEDFNDAISAALNKSGLFAMVVTPNLINEENYVMTTEYPMAVKAEKPILPAEIVPTDRAELVEKYVDIPPCTDAHNESDLTASLLQIVEKIAIKENDKNPEHNFFIGLAYLAGIDVEIDKERAVDLIEGSANAGLPEAMEKLVQMYRMSDGVERNYETAIEWQKKLVDKLTEIYKESDDNDDCYNLLLAVRKLGEYYTTIKKLDDAKLAFMQMKKIGEELYEKTNDKTALNIFSASCTLLGLIADSQGDLKEAKANHLKALKIDKQRLKEEETTRAHLNLSKCYFNLGTIYSAEDKIEKAMDYYTLALEELDVIIENDEYDETEEAEEALNDCSNIFLNVGDLYEKMGDLSAAKKEYSQCLESYKELAEETKTVEARNHLSLSYSRLGNICELEGHLAEAKDYYLKCLEIDEQIWKETETLSAYRELSMSYECLGEISEAEGDLSNAKEYYLKTLEIQKELAESTNTVQAREDLSLSYNNLGDVYRKEENMSEAKDSYLQSLKIREELAKETGTVKARKDLYDSYFNLGSFRLLKRMVGYKIDATNEEIIEAEAYLKKGLELINGLVEETQSVELRKNFGVIYCNLGYISHSKKELEKAETYYLKGLEIIEAILEEAQTLDIYKLELRLLNNLGNICTDMQDIDEAKEYFEKALKVAQRLAQENENIESRDDLALIYWDLALFDKKHYNIEMLQKAHAVWKELKEEFPDNPIYDKWEFISRFQLPFSYAQYYFKKLFNLK